jgi:hypothetical protein
VRRAHLGVAALGEAVVEARRGDPIGLVHRFAVPLELRLKRTANVLYELSGFRPLDARGGPPR